MRNFSMLKIDFPKKMLCCVGTIGHSNLLII